MVNDRSRALAPALLCLLCCALGVAGRRLQQEGEGDGFAVFGDSLDTSNLCAVLRSSPRAGAQLVADAAAAAPPGSTRVLAHKLGSLLMLADAQQCLPDAAAAVAGAAARSDPAAAVLAGALALSSGDAASAALAGRVTALALCAGGQQEQTMLAAWTSAAAGSGGPAACGVLTGALRQAKCGAGAAWTKLCS